MSTTSPGGDGSPFVNQEAHIERINRGEPAPADLQRLVDGIRSLMAWSVSARPEHDCVDFGAVANLVEAAVAALPEGTTLASRYVDDEGRAGVGSFNPNRRGTHPLLGTANPVAPPIFITAADGMVTGDLVFDVHYEGNVGWAHGGFIAAGFDIVCGQSTLASGQGGPTGTLSVRYVSPTPVGVPLRYTGWVDRVEGRKIFVGARLAVVADDRTCATAEAIFIARAD